ncbi:RNA-directed DNA polymerase, eukaryota [Tanacetum coccineum]
MAQGSSGGLISLWDPNLFMKFNIWCDEAYIIMQGQWTNSDGDFFMVNIYGPQDSSAKSSLWSRIRDFMHHHVGNYILFGDLNEVREESERYGSSFSRGKLKFLTRLLMIQA